MRDQGDQFPEQRSKGFQWFLSFYLRLAAAQKESDVAQFLLIDEPGSYLHARAQRDILDLFESRIAPYEQVLYTTHSPYLLPGDKLHRVRVVIKNVVGGTRVLDRLTHPAIRGDEFADTLSPILTSLGLDVREALSFVKPHNLIVEGITDHWYLTRWAAELKPELFTSVNVFPAFGAKTIPLFASLFTGWGLPFVVLVDRDNEGEKTKAHLDKHLGVPPDQVVQPKDAITIEDLFSTEDFRKLLAALDASLSIETGERPSAAIERQKIDKVLLARKFSELHTSGLTLTAKTKTAVQRLLGDIASSVQKAVAKASDGSSLE